MGWELRSRKAAGAALLAAVAVGLLLPDPASGQQPPPEYEERRPPPPKGPASPPPGYEQPRYPARPASEPPGRSSPRTRRASPPPQRPRAAQQPPGYHTHDGFFLRLSIGGGYTLGIERSDGSTFRLRGVSSALSFAIGGAVTENLILHADVFGGVAPRPILEVDGKEEGRPDALSLSGLGGGVTYYSMPANIYFSAAVGVGVATVEVDFVEFQTDPGLAIDVLIGKEWWVGSNWGIGAAAQLKYFRLPDGGQRFNAYAPALLFSATYN